MTTVPDPDRGNHRSAYRRWSGRAGLAVVVIVAAVVTAVMVGVAIDLVVRFV